MAVKGKPMSIRLDAKERETIEAAARTRGRTLSAQVRDSALLVARTLSRRGSPADQEGIDGGE